MTGPPRKDRMAIHMLTALSDRPQTGNDGDDGNTEQHASRHLGIANRRADLILQVRITQGVGYRIEALHQYPGECEAITPRDRQGVEAEGFDLAPHRYSTALSAAALASRPAISALAPFNLSLILDQE